MQFTFVICVPRAWWKTYCRSSNLCNCFFFLAFLGVYYSLSCEPTFGENQIFHSVVKRQVIKTRDAIKLIGDGLGQKLKKDKVIESCIKVDIGRMWRREKLMSSFRKAVKEFCLFQCLFISLFFFLFFFFMCTESASQLCLCS